jgi:hypothetical protein
MFDLFLPSRKDVTPKVGVHRKIAGMRQRDFWGRRVGDLIRIEIVRIAIDSMAREFIVLAR